MEKTRTLLMPSLVPRLKVENRGFGTDKTTVLVALSLSEQGYPRFTKMEVIPDVKGTTLT